VPGSVPPGAVSRKRAGRRPRRQGTAASGVFCRRASGAWRAGKRACGSWEIGRPTGVRLRQAAHSGASCRAAALCRAACWCIDGERSWPRTLARYKGRCVGHQMRRPLWSKSLRRGAAQPHSPSHQCNNFPRTVQRPANEGCRAGLGLRANMGVGSVSRGGHSGYHRPARPTAWPRAPCDPTALASLVPPLGIQGPDRAGRRGLDEPLGAAAGCPVFARSVRASVRVGVAHGAESNPALSNHGRATPSPVNQHGRLF